MDRNLSVGQLMSRCKDVIESITEADDLQTVASAGVAIFEQMREVARVLLQAKGDLEAHKLHSQAVRPYCVDTALTYVHTRTVQPTTLFGPIESLSAPFVVTTVVGALRRMRPRQPTVGNLFSLLQESHGNTGR